jgi:hypothetical protein
MKPCSTIVALCALLFCSVGSVRAEEMPSPIFTALSSTTISGYVNTSAHWQRHVCRPVRPVRVHRLYKLSHGVIREIGYTVRCRHGDVYLPNGRIAELLPAPNRSSRFSSDATTPRIDDRTAVILIEAHRIPRRPDRPFPPLPPLPPSDIGGGGLQSWHVVHGSVQERMSVFPPPRPQPTNSVTPPRVIVEPPDHGSSGMESNRLPPNLPNERRMPPTMPPPPTNYGPPAPPVVVPPLPPPLPPPR